MTFLKEVYLSIFVLFFRMGAGQWPASFNADAHKGFIGLAIFENFLLLDAFFLLQVETGQHIELHRWMVGVALTLTFIFNYYFLITRRHGILFENRFNEFSREKRITLFSISVVIILTIAAATYFIGTIYRHMFFGR